MAAYMMLQLIQTSQSPELLFAGNEMAEVPTMNGKVMRNKGKKNLFSRDRER